MRMLERQQALSNLRPKGMIPPERGGSGVGFMGGLFALSMPHNDVTKTWADFDNQIRMMRGVMAGKLTDQDVQELRQGAIDVASGTLFSPEKVAEVFKAQANRGVPLMDRVTDGVYKGQLLGAVVARQILGIATATGESPEEAFQTHLMIAQGFGMKSEEFAQKFPAHLRHHRASCTADRRVDETNPDADG